jgi:CubicO group peptidase (beta-lactamase class C family)
MQRRFLKPLSFLLILSAAVSIGRGQDMKAYEGHWESPLSNDKVFNLAISVRLISNSTATLSLSNEHSSISRNFHFENGKAFQIAIDSNTIFKAVADKNSGALRAFIQSGQWQYHLLLKKKAFGYFTGLWSILLAVHFRSPFYLSIEDATGEQYNAYAFSAEARFPRFGCYNFQKKGDSLHFNEFHTGLQFDGKLLDKAIFLKIKMAGINLAEFILHPSTKDWDLQSKAVKKAYINEVPADLHDGITISNIHQAGFKEEWLKKMTDSINANSVTNIQSVLIMRKRRLVFEQYYGGFDADAPHDLRSAAKSISSAMIGIAMDKGILSDTGQKLFDLLPEKYRYAEKSDPRKSAISIASLLTMSSGLDAIDFGIDRISPASEDVYQDTPDWLKTVVEAPMINQPGSHANYSSANPFLLGIILNTQLKQPLEFFMDDNLFAPLGINSYLVQNDCFNQPYFGGGMFLRPRDMLKFGLLYSQQGRWNDRQLISKKWVDASFKKYLVLENHPEKNEYGFLWWHFSYKVNNKIITSVEARGAGGQYIFIIPDYELVVVITSANYRNGRVWQPEKIMENYILPALQ